MADCEDARERALEELRACAQRLGRAPSMRQFRNDPATTVHPQRIARMFGSGGWNAARRAAGLAITARRSDEQLLDALTALAARLGRSPMVSDIAQDTDCASPSLYVQRFGSLDAARTRAGIVADPPVDVEAMIDAGVRLADHLGHLPSWSEWGAHRIRMRLPSEWKIYRRWGGEGAWDRFCYEILERQGQSSSSARRRDSGAARPASVG